jgi:hypothetical protein
MAGSASRTLALVFGAAAEILSRNECGGARALKSGRAVATNAYTWSLVTKPLGQFPSYRYLSSTRSFRPTTGSVPAALCRGHGRGGAWRHVSGAGWIRARALRRKAAPHRGASASCGGAPPARCGFAIPGARHRPAAAAQARTLRPRYLNFYGTAEQYLPDIRWFSPATRILVDAHDVHGLRERRRAELAGDSAGLAAAERTRQAEGCDLLAGRPADRRQRRRRPRTA